MPKPLQRTLIKLGGSLLDLPDLRDRLRRLAQLRCGHSVAYLPGGGETADLVRIWSDRFPLDDHAAHWLAIDAMGLNARLLAELLPDSRLVAEASALQQAEAGGVSAILAAGPLLRQIAEAGGPSLPESWDVTSDSIAAFLAGVLGFDELILAKSCEPAARTPAGLAERGLVDPAFPEVARDLPGIGWVNLREERLRIEPLTRRDAC